MSENVSEQRPPLPAAPLHKLGELAVSSAREGPVHTLLLFGELDLATVAAVERELERVEASDASSIVVDLSGLTFMDSTGVRLLLTAYARSRTHTDRLTLRRGPAAVQRALELSGVARHLPFED